MPIWLASMSDPSTSAGTIAPGCDALKMTRPGRAGELPPYPPVNLSGLAMDRKNARPVSHPGISRSSSGFSIYQLHAVDNCGLASRLQSRTSPVFAALVLGQSLQDIDLTSGFFGCST